MTPMEVQQLTELTQQQSLIMDTVPIQMWFLTDAETYGRVNQFHADFMGLKKENMEFKKIKDVLPVSYADACHASNYKVFNARETVYSEEWVRDSRNNHRLIQITKTPRFDEEGNVQYIVCFGLDITEQKQAESVLSQAEENFRTFIETIDDIIVVGNADGRIIYANPAASGKLGYTFDEMCSLNILELHPEFVREEAKLILNDMFSGKRESCPLPLITKEGVLIPVETRAWNGRWNGIDGIFGLSKDLSKEQEALQKFDRLFRMNPALIAVSKMPERIFSDINDAFTDVLGYTRDEVVGKTSTELNLFVDDEDQKHVAMMLAEYGHIHNVELKVRTKSGEIRDGLFSGDLIESQGVSFFLTTMIDITDKNQAEDKLRKTIRDLETALTEIKSLRGIIPICTSCKKIRDDKGYWEQVENYISKHTQARFSHGICPDCMKRDYPEFNNDEE